MSVIKSTKQPTKVLIETAVEVCEIDVKDIECLTISDSMLVVESRTIPDLYIHYPAGGESVALLAKDLAELAGLRLEHIDADANSVSEVIAGDVTVPVYLVLTPSVYGEIPLDKIKAIFKYEAEQLEINHLTDDNGVSTYYRVGADHQDSVYHALRQVVFADYPA